MKKSTRILLAIVLCLVLIAISVPKFFSFSSYQYDHAARYTAGGCEIDQQVENIDVSWIDGKVKVERHGGDEIILSETANRKMRTAEQVHWLLDGDTLYVKYMRAGKNSTFWLDKELTLLLPENMKLEDVRISGVSAELEAELPAAETVTVDSVSGTVDVTMQKTEKARVDTVSGDVTICFANVPASIDADAVSGDLTVQLPEDAGFTAKLDSVSGRISGELLEGVTDVKKEFVRGNGACSISMDSVSGALQMDAYTR